MHTGPDLPSAGYLAVLEKIPALREPAAAATAGSESPGVLASAIELILEGLHLSKRLNKESAGARATYRTRS